MTLSVISKLAETIRRFRREERGAAAVEIAIWTAALVVPVFGTVDLGNYTYKQMQVNSAAQAAAQRAFLLCTTAASLPAIKNCTNLTTNMTQAAQATGLGTGVTLGTTTEGYYCANSSGALILVGTIGSGTTAPVKPNPFTCDSVTTGSTAQPGDYIAVTAKYTFAPLFGNISLSKLLPTTVTRTAWMRLSS